jgi:hypothetical protein
MHRHLATSERDDAGPLERGQEAAAALPRGARELRDLGLRGADQDVGVRRASGLPRDGLGEQGARHPARDGLEGLLEQPLVRLAHPLGEACEQLQSEVRVPLDQPLHVRREQRDGAGGLDDLGGGRARLAPEHRELAEEHPGVQLRERHHAAVLVLAREHDRPRPEQVAGVAHVALAEDHLAPVPVAWHGHLCHLPELVRVEVAEHLRGRQEPHGLVHGRHEAHNPI